MNTEFSVIGIGDEAHEIGRLSAAGIVVCRTNSLVRLPDLRSKT